MPAYICQTCGVQFTKSVDAPTSCPICDDDRQYIGANGQQWTTLADLQATHKNVFSPIEHNLTRIKTEPSFAIGQSAHLIQTDDGNILWECNSLIDEETVAEIQARGDLKAIAISHPHFYDAMIDWSNAFGGIPIYLHASNQDWVMRADDVIHYWSEETLSLGDGVTLIRCGGHFPGSSVLHWQNGADGKGVLLTGDTMTVTPDKHVTFMYSYPNSIPLNAKAIRQIVNSVEPYSYDRLYSSWENKVIKTNAKAIVNKSMKRYISHLK